MMLCQSTRLSDYASDDPSPNKYDGKAYSDVPDTFEAVLNQAVAYVK